MLYNRVAAVGFGDRMIRDGVAEMARIWLEHLVTRASHPVVDWHLQQILGRQMLPLSHPGRQYYLLWRSLLLLGRVFVR